MFKVHDNKDNAGRNIRVKLGEREEIKEGMVNKQECGQAKV